MPRLRAGTNKNKRAFPQASDPTIHLGRTFSTALLVALLPQQPAEAQNGGRTYYLSLSRSVAATFGKTWQLGKQCGVALDGLSRAAAQRLFSRRLEEAELAEVLGVYDEAAGTPGGGSCERRALSEEVSHADQLLRRYLQVPAPINRMEFSSPPKKSF